MNKALDILNKIFNLGYEAYIVGGYPRDKYLNIKSNDIDICTNMPIELLKDNFKVVTDNSKFGSLIIDNNIEITIYRKDIYLNNRYPMIEKVETLEQDLYRRDFTINTLCIDKDNKYIDLYDARKDINNKIIRMIDKTDKRIKEDPLRMLRAIRFSLKLNFKLEEQLEQAIISNSNLLTKISKNNIEKEIKKMIKYKDIEVVKSTLKKYGLEVNICMKN